jgi:regulator of RNase E activity RraA
VLTRAAAEVHRALADAALAPIDDLAAAFGTLAVANIGDARERMGMLDGGIRAPWRGARIVGRARTVWTRPGDNLAIHQVLPHCRPGDVLVVNGGGDTTRALIGELIAEKAKAKAVVGMIIDGVVRDGVELERIGFPVWSRGLCPAGPYKNGPGRVNVPVAVGGVLSHTPTAWWHTLAKAAPSFGVIGITIIAAFSASDVLAELGLADQLEGVLSSLNAPAWIMALAIGVIIVLIAIPLTASATMAAVGPVAVVALVGAGIPAPIAATAVLICASTEGASPPSGAPIYVASGIARVDPVKTFIPLLKYYCLPILAIGYLIAVGVLPV